MVWKSIIFIMKTHLIEYHQYHGGTSDTFNESPFTLDGIGYDLESDFKLTSKDSIYSRCPAWKHRSNRVFTVFAPKDITLTVNVENGSLKTPNLSQNDFNSYFGGAFFFDWCTLEKVTIQSSIPRFVFWSKSKNIWIEQRPHPLTSLNNNFVCVGGWYNMTNWIRPVSFGFDVVDPSNPIIIRRGDPLYQISFHSTNQNDGFKVKKSEPSDDLIKKLNRTQNAINTYNQNLPQDIKNTLFKNKDSKCPFHFLWNK